MALLIDLIILIICVFPKINIINIPGSSTGIRLEDILILVCFILYVKRNHMQFKLSDKMKKIVVIFSLYILVTIISTIIACGKSWVQPILGALYIIRKIEYFLMIFLGYHYWKVNKKVNYKLFFDIVIVVNFIISILQLRGFVGSFNAGIMLDTLTQGRISSVFNGAYEYSAFLLLLLPIYLYNVIFEKRYRDCIFIILILFGIIITKSRSSLLIGGLIIFCMLLSTKEPRKILKDQVILLILAVFIVAIGINFINLDRFEQLNATAIVDACKLAFPSGNFEKYIKTGDWYGNSEYTIYNLEDKNIDASLYLRLVHWMQMLDGLNYSPIIGVGASISGSAADGNYIRILCESGILGLIIWIYMLIAIFKYLKNDKFHLIIKMMLLSIVLGSLMIDIFEASRIMMLFWFMLGAMYSNEVNRNEK